jgi:aspartate racemase
MGPLASAEFVKTIYECASHRREQDTPAVIMYSDPSFPDRTESLLSGRTEELLDRLVAALDFLCRAHVSKTVMACITVHHWLPQVPADLRATVRSLVDVIADALVERRRPHLLLCSTGTRRMGLFEQHARWTEMQPYLVLPGDADQDAIHQLIYGVKRDGDVQTSIAAVATLLGAYGVSDFVAGCTEFHFAAKAVDRASGVGVVDPLLIVAQELAAGRI